MRIRNLLVCTAIFTAALFTASPGFAQAPAGRLRPRPRTRLTRERRDSGFGTTRPIPTMS